MSEQKKRGPKAAIELDDFGKRDSVYWQGEYDEKRALSGTGKNVTAANLGGRSLRKIFPLGMRVLVRLIKDKDTSDGGLYLPEGAKQLSAESLLAEVIEVASAVDENSEEETNVSGIPLGALVLIPKDAGLRVPWDDNLRIVETKNILATVNEISIL